MKRFIVLAALAASFASLFAQTSVWKVTQGDSTLYLGGTCHVLRPSDFPLPAEFDQAYAAAKVLYFETDLARAQSPEMQQIVMAKGLFASGKSLESALSPEAWKAVTDYCAKRGIPVAQMQAFKPWLFAMMVTVMELQKMGVSQEGVDLHFFNRAKADGKATHELESFEEHIGFVTAMGDDNPSDFILQGLGDLEDALTEFPDLLKAWRDGDLGALEKLMNSEMREKYPQLHAKLLVQRNNAWMKKLEALLATPDVEFVLAGAGHMSGPEGLVAQLRARGCTVEQVIASRKE